MSKTARVWFKSRGTSRAQSAAQKGTLCEHALFGAANAAHATKTTTRAQANVSLPAHITQQSLKYLDRVGRHATHVGPLTSGRFIPLVFSAGGLMAKDTASELEIWRKEMGATKFTRMITLLSMALLKGGKQELRYGKIR